MNRISRISRRNIINILINGFDEMTLLGDSHCHYAFYCLLNPLEFLKRLYPLKKLSSKDSRGRNVDKDIWVHTTPHPVDYSEGWGFENDWF